MTPDYPHRILPTKWWYWFIPQWHWKRTEFRHWLKWGIDRRHKMVVRPDGPGWMIESDMLDPDKLFRIQIGKIK